MKIITRIKEFYLLEMLQLTLYESQLKSLQNQYIRYGYQRMVELEKNHVNFFKNYLLEHNEKIPSVSSTLTSLAGKVLGKSTDLTTAANRYKLGAAVENKAIEMYRVFIIEAWEEPALCQRLWHNMVDEEFHLLWFKDNQKHISALTQST